MEFSFAGYGALLDLLKTNNYSFSDYHSWHGKEKSVILRHDIDYDLSRAVPIAKIEHGEGIKSTYFVLTTTDFYNVFSMDNNKLLEEIINLGHEIGLHFDEARYPDLYGDVDAIKEKILDECLVLEKAISCKISTVSMHRPSQAIIEADLKLPGVVNSYSTVFFKTFKYMSDSRRRWRESVEDIIKDKRYDFLHILTHPFWYCEEEVDIHDAIFRFVNNASYERYETIGNNITDICSIMDESEVLKG